MEKSWTWNWMPIFSAIGKRRTQRAVISEDRTSAVVHEGGWELATYKDGEWHFHNPDGLRDIYWPCRRWCEASVKDTHA